MPWEDEGRRIKGEIRYVTSTLRDELVAANISRQSIAIPYCLDKNKRFEWLVFRPKTSSWTFEFSDASGSLLYSSLKNEHVGNDGKVVQKVLHALVQGLSAKLPSLKSTLTKYIGHEKK